MTTSTRSRRKRAQREDGCVIGDDLAIVGQGETMLTWDRVVRVEGPDGEYVLRAGPEGRPPVMTPPYGALFFYLWEKARQLVRSEPWTVTVQHVEDFPYGPAIWEGACRSRRHGLHLLDAIRDDLRVRGLEPTVEVPESEVEGAP